MFNFGFRVTSNGCCRGVPDASVGVSLDLIWSILFDCIERRLKLLVLVLCVDLATNE